MLTPAFVFSLSVVGRKQITDIMNNPQDQDRHYWEQFMNNHEQQLGEWEQLVQQVRDQDPAAFASTLRAFQEQPIPFDGSAETEVNSAALLDYIEGSA